MTWRYFVESLFSSLILCISLFFLRSNLFWHTKANKILQLRSMFIFKLGHSTCHLMWFFSHACCEQIRPHSSQTQGVKNNSISSFFFILAHLIQSSLWRKALDDIVIHSGFWFDLAQGHINGAPPATWTHSGRFVSQGIYSIYLWVI